MLYNSRYKYKRVTLWESKISSKLVLITVGILSFIGYAIHNMYEYLLQIKYLIE